MASSKIAQLQLLQQNLQNILTQKQQLQNQLVELDSALAELNTTDKAYKIVGKIMLAAPKQDLIKELNEKKEFVSVRIKNFSQQEEKLQKNFEEVQSEVVKEMQAEKKTSKK
jgi:prefoldin beta subunit